MRTHMPFSFFEAQADTKAARSIVLRIFVRIPTAPR
jgi:hypothetical protein